MTSMTKHVRTTDQEPAEREPTGASQGVPRDRVTWEVAITLGPAGMVPTGPSIRDVTSRLRGHIGSSRDYAERFILTILKSTRRRYVVPEANRHAREPIAAAVDCGVPGARLRLRAMAADHLSRYAQAYRTRREAL